MADDLALSSNALLVDNKVVLIAEQLVALREGCGQYRRLNRWL